MSTQINFRKYPYKGIFKEIAEELGISMQGARQSKSPKVRKMVARKVQQRRREHAAYLATLGAEA